jgi:hypothetical protein
MNDFDPKHEPAGPRMNAAVALTLTRAEASIVADTLRFRARNYAIGAHNYRRVGNARVAEHGDAMAAQLDGIAERVERAGSEVRG